jgi:hypothetical protein
MYSVGHILLYLNSWVLKLWNKKTEEAFAPSLMVCGFVEALVSGHIRVNLVGPRQDAAL